MKITRRQLALAVAGGAGTVAAAPILAQNPPAPAQTPAVAPNSPPAAPDWDQAARAAHLQSAQALAKIDVPMVVEPAFLFRA